jgi:hypothetical protein
MLSDVITGARSRTRQTSVEVPPMSYVMKSRTSAAPPTWQAWLTPPAGPEKIVLMGRRRAVSVVIMPPLEPTVSTPWP